MVYIAVKVTGSALGNQKLLRIIKMLLKMRKNSNENVFTGIDSGEDKTNEAVASEKRARRTDNKDKDKDLTVEGKAEDLHEDRVIAEMTLITYNRHVKKIDSIIHKLD